MNERQYQRTVHNRWMYDTAPLLAAGELPRILGRLREQQGCQAAAEAWRCVAPGCVQAVTTVESFEKGTVRIGVGDVATRHYLIQRAGRLRRQLGELLGGVRALRFELRSELAEDGAGSR